MGRGKHVMLSYNWDHQDLVSKIGLEKYLEKVRHRRATRPRDLGIATSPALLATQKRVFLLYFLRHRRATRLGDLGIATSLESPSTGLTNRADREFIGPIPIAVGFLLFFQKLKPADSEPIPDSNKMRCDN